MLDGARTCKTSEQDVNNYIKRLPDHPERKRLLRAINHSLGAHTAAFDVLLHGC